MLYFVSNSHFLAISTNLLFLRKRKNRKSIRKKIRMKIQIPYIYTDIYVILSLKDLFFVCSKLISGKQKYNI